MKSQKWLVRVAVAIFIVLAFSFQASAAGTKWRLQHSWGAAENHFFEHYAKIVNEMSAGKIQISVFADGELVNVISVPLFSKRQTKCPGNFEASR